MSAAKRSADAAVQCGDSALKRFKADAAGDSAVTEGSPATENKALATSPPSNRGQPGEHNAIWRSVNGTGYRGGTWVLFGWLEWWERAPAGTGGEGNGGAGTEGEGDGAGGEGDAGAGAEGEGKGDGGTGVEGEGKGDGGAGVEGEGEGDGGAGTGGEGDGGAGGEGDGGAGAEGEGEGDGGAGAEGEGEGAGGEGDGGASAGAEGEGEGNGYWDNDHDYYDGPDGPGQKCFRWRSCKVRPDDEWVLLGWTEWWERKTGPAW